MNTKQQMQAAVKRGALLLDNKVPDWYNKIDLASLNMDDGMYCIVGQINREGQLLPDNNPSPYDVGYSNTALEILGLTTEFAGAYIRKNPSYYGFFAIEDDDSDSDGDWDYLGDLWRYQIRKRRVASMVNAT
jgi:hypothetical protein